MLKVYDASGAFVTMIPDTDYRDAALTKTLSDGDKQLSFTYTGDPRTILNEYYIETSEDRFVVKEVHPGDHSTGYVCKLDLEDLEQSIVQTFTAQNKTVTQAATSALSGTGWTISTTITKKRSVQTIKKTPLEILYKIRDAFMCEISFDTQNKVVTFADQLGQDRGVYLRSDVNLKSLTPTYDSYDYYTRLIPIGADGLTIDNDGKNYVENYTYSSKIRTLIWEDTSYTDATELMTDAIGKLSDLAAPKRSYSASMVDLARIPATDSRTDYEFLLFDIGDTIKITDEATGVMEKQRIVKMVIYPDDPTKNTVELSNTVLTWEELQARYKAAADAWEDISNPDGSVNGVYVHGVQAGDVVGVEVTSGESKTLQEAVVILQTGIASATSTATSASATAANALTTADGKNTVIYSASQPSTSGRKVNDVWFDTDDGYKMYAYTGSAWSAAQFGQNAIAANSITANHIVAGAVTAGKISVDSLSAINANMGTITAGQVSVYTTIDGDVYQGILRCSGGSAARDGGLRMFEVWDTTAVKSQFYVSTGGLLFALNADITGKVTASSGAIGGWNITEKAISKSFTLDSDTYTVVMRTADGATSHGVQGTIRPIEVFKTSGGVTSSQFYVGSDGYLMAQNASIVGTVSANSGRIVLNSTGVIAGTRSSYTITETEVAELGITSMKTASGTFAKLDSSGMAQFVNSSGCTLIEGQNVYVGKRVIVGVDDVSNYVDINAGNSMQMTIALHSIGTSDIRLSGGQNMTGSLVCSDAGNFGLYDRSNSRWMLYADKAGDLYCPRTLYQSGSVVFSATAYLTNNIYLMTRNTSSENVPLVGWSSSDALWVGPYQSAVAKVPASLNLGAKIDTIYCYNASGTRTLLKTAVSDRRLKHDIEDLQDAKKLIMGLSAKKFKLNGDERTHYGFIAQDVRPLLTDDNAILAYNPVGDADTYDKDDDSTYTYSMDYTQFVAPLVATVQEQERELERLKAENKSLKDDLAEVREMLAQLIEQTA